MISVLLDIVHMIVGTGSAAVTGSANTWQCIPVRLTGRSPV